MNKLVKILFIGLGVFSFSINSFAHSIHFKKILHSLTYEHEHSHNDAYNPNQNMVHSHGGVYVAPANNNYAQLPGRVIRVQTSDDMRFRFLDNMAIRIGETITFVVTNIGRVPHEFSIGDEQNQAMHRKAMHAHPNMAHTHNDTITLNPGETKTLTWNFKNRQALIIACNLPGHFESGMHNKIVLNS